MTEALRPDFIEPAAWEVLREADRRQWEQYATDLGWLAKQPQFRRVLVWLREIGGVDAPVFEMDTRPLDPLRAAVREGERRTVMQLWRQLQAVAPEMLQRSLNEQWNRRDPAEETKES